MTEEGAAVVIQARLRGSFARKCATSPRGKAVQHVVDAQVHLQKERRDGEERRQAEAEEEQQRARRGQEQEAQAQEELLRLWEDHELQQTEDKRAAAAATARRQAYTSPLGSTSTPRIH